MKIEEYKNILRQRASKCEIEPNRIIGNGRLFGNRYFQIIAEKIEVPDIFHCMLHSLRSMVLIEDDIIDKQFLGQKKVKMLEFAQKCKSDSEKIAIEINKNAHEIMLGYFRRYNKALKTMKIKDETGWRMHSMQKKIRQMKIAFLPLYLLQEIGFDMKLIRLNEYRLLFIMKFMQIFDDIMDREEDTRLRIKTSTNMLSFHQRKKSFMKSGYPFLEKAMTDLSPRSLMYHYIEEYRKLFDSWLENPENVDITISPIQPILI